MSPSYFRVTHAVVRYFEKSYSHYHFNGKRVLEVGSGCGLVGIYLALHGAHVTLTDMPKVLPILRQNLGLNLKRHNLVPSFDDENAAVAVREYTWGKDYEDGYLSPPYDYIVAADCIYNGDTIDFFVAAVVRMCGPRTTFIFSNEKRDELVYERLMAELDKRFRIKLIPRTKLHEGARNDLIIVSELKLRRGVEPYKVIGLAPGAEPDEPGGGEASSVHSC